MKPHRREFASRLRTPKNRIPIGTLKNRQRRAWRKHDRKNPSCFQKLLIWILVFVVCSFAYPNAALPFLIAFGLPKLAIQLIDCLVILGFLYWSFRHFFSR